MIELVFYICVDRMDYLIDGPGTIRQVFEKKVGALYPFTCKSEFQISLFS